MNYINPGDNDIRLYLEESVKFLSILEIESEGTLINVYPPNTEPETD